MIANGRRIEQRTELGTREGLERFEARLTAQGFDPFRFDGRDPAAFVCAMAEMEHSLQHQGDRALEGELDYPVRIPYGIAETVKGFGFYGAGLNAAHNLPLPGNPRMDTHARELFQEHASRLWVAPDELANSVLRLKEHEHQARPLSVTIRWQHATRQSLSFHPSLPVTTRFPRCWRWTTSSGLWLRKTLN